MQLPVRASIDFGRSASSTSFFWLYCTLASTTVLVVAVYLYPSSGFFLYDDARMILQNRPPDAWHLVRAFFELRDGFYRPLFEVALGLEALVFSTNPLGYHLVNASIHLLTGAAVYLATACLVDRRAAIVATAFFLASAGHAEPVIWIGGLHTLLPGLFAAVSFVLYLRVVTSESFDTTAYLASIGIWVLALLAKESAYTVPLAIAVYHLLYPGQSNLRRSVFIALPRLLPFLGIMAVYAPFRLSHGTGYSLQALDISPPALMKNIIGYLVSTLTPLPDDYRYLSSLPLWRSEPLLPFAILILGIAVLAILGANGLVSVLRRERAVLFGIAWFLLTLLPVVAIYAERQIYLPSIGTAIAVGAVFAGCMDRSRSSQQRAIIGCALILLLAANLLGLAERSYWWKAAGELSRDITNEVVEKTNGLKPGTTLVVLAVPDILRQTHVQGAHLPWTIELATNGAVRADSVLIGSFVWPSPENAKRELPSELLNDPKQVVVDLRPVLDARFVRLMSPE